MLFDYQERFVSAVDHLISVNWVRRRPSIALLDMGCDCSGRQLSRLSRLVSGEAVGINIPANFPDPAAVAAAGQGVKLMRMDGMRLEFPDETFDLVISANVLEHVPDPVKFISEASRVLKPNGVCYMETAPVWSGPRGHHIMDSMISENCPAETQFRDDGSVVPEWSHLELSRDQMAEVIGSKVLPETREYILWYLYDSGDLNKCSWSLVRDAFDRAFEHVSFNVKCINGVDSSLMPADGKEDYLVYGFEAVCRKRKCNRYVDRFIRLLRRVGL